MQLMQQLRRAPRNIPYLDFALVKIGESNRFILAIFVYDSMVSTTQNLILNKHQAISLVV